MLFLGCVLGIAGRAPRLLVHPRLVAEEATVYLAYAFSHDFLSTLLFVPTSDGPAGYLHLVANLGALIATTLPLDWAAVVGTTIAFGVQLVPLSIVVWGRSRLWPTPAQRALACGLILFGTPVRPEIWLQIIQAQLFLGAAAFLILFEVTERLSAARALYYRLLLALGATTGAYTVLLAPVYLFRLRQRPSREARIQASIVAGGALLQAACLIGYWASGSGVDRLASLRNPDVAWVVLSEHWIQPFLGATWLPFLRGLSPTIGALSLLLVLAAMAGLYVALRSHDPLDAKLVVGSLGVTSLATAVLAHGLPVGRYAVVPGLILLVTAARLCWYPGSQPRIRTLGRLLVAAAAISGALAFWPAATGTAQEEVNFVHHRPGYPSWPEELDRWRADPYRALSVWPYSATSSWKTHLVATHQFRGLRQEFRRADDVHLVTRAESPRSIRVPLSQLPPDFRLRLKAEASPREAPAQLTLRLLDGEGSVWFEREVPRQEAGRYALDLNRVDLQGTSEDLEATRSLEIESRTEGPQVVVAIDHADVEPRVRGLLDPLLPVRALPSLPLATPLDRPRPEEATALLAVASLEQERDLRFTESDRERASRRWRDGPLGIDLVRRPGEDPAYNLAGIFALLLAGASQIAGPTAGIVACNLGLLVLLTAYHLYHRWHQSRSSRLFALLALPFSLLTGFALLPTSTMLELACLIFPVVSWVDGGWNQATPLRLALWGALLTLAVGLEPTWLALALPLSIWEFWRPTISGRGRSFLIVGSLATLATLTFLPEVFSIEGIQGWKRAAPIDPAWSGLADLYVTRQGWLLGYPFSVVAALHLLDRKTPSRSLALGILLVTLASLVAVTAGTSGLLPPLGESRVAILLSLLVVLPQRIQVRPALWMPLAVSVLATWATVSRIWIL